MERAEPPAAKELAKRRKEERAPGVGWAQVEAQRRAEAAIRSDGAPRCTSARGVKALVLVGLAAAALQFFCLVAAFRCPELPGRNSTWDTAWVNDTVCL